MCSVTLQDLHRDPLGFPAMLSMPARFLYGIYQLVSRPAYRQSWYGWLWLFLMWINLCLVALVIGH